MEYNKKLQGTFFEYSCKDCQYITRNKNNYEKHLLTKKHKNTTKSCKKLQDAESCDLYFCGCGKKYPYRASLYNHKKKCEYIKNGNEKIDKDEKINNDEKIDIKSKTNYIKSYKKKDKTKQKECDNIDYKDIIIKLLDDNAEFKNLLIKQQNQIGELIPKIGNNNTNIKQKFNINIFLNEQCKDAINIDDFIKQIEVSLDNLLTTRDKGLSEGLSNVFIENMNKLSIYERPLHCTDIKRETLYIKDNDVWEKDCDKSRIKTALRELSCAQFRSVKKWMEENPDYEENERKQEEFINLIKNCSENINDIDDKIIKRLCNNIYLKERINE